jgi:hypothetical protein
MEYAPFEFIDENGKQVGINIELAEEAAKLLGAELEVTRIPFPSMIPGLAAGRFKVAWETFAATDDRLKQVDFVMFIKSGIVASTTPDKAPAVPEARTISAASASASSPARSPISDRRPAERRVQGEGPGRTRPSRTCSPRARTSSRRSCPTALDAKSRRRDRVRLFRGHQQVVSWSWCPASTTSSPLGVADAEG